MSLTDDLKSEVRTIFNASWDERVGRTVPDPTQPSISLGNDGIKLDATMLYADLADSTDLVTKFPPRFAAEIIKAFLRCACRVIRAKEGHIVSFDGDRVMAIYIGEMKNTRAVRSALAINHAVKKVIIPAAEAEYSLTRYRLGHAVGIDAGAVFVARTGVRSYNDLVWVGRAANIAAKLSAVRHDGVSTLITSTVFGAMAPDEVRYTRADKKDMWRALTWQGMTIYGSTYEWAL